MSASRLRRLASFAAKAVHRPPGFVLRRAIIEARRQVRRPLSRWRRPLSAERLLAATGTGSIDALWERVARAPFFLQAADRARMAAAFTAQHPAAVDVVLARAEAVLRHEFDLLGSGPCALGPSLPWHEDFKSGTSWPLEYAHDLDVRPSSIGRPT